MVATTEGNSGGRKQSLQAVDLSEYNRRTSTVSVYKTTEQTHNISKEVDQ